MKRSFLGNVMAPPSDAVQSFRPPNAGHERYLAEAFVRYGPRLARIVAWRLDPRLRGRTDVDDVLQEAYLAAVQRYDHYRSSDPQFSLFLWMRLIVGQTLADVHRRHLGTRMRDARLDISLDRPARPSNAASWVHNVQGQLTSPSQAMMRKEASSALQDALQRLRSNDREILVLRHFEELSNGEVAELLALTHKAASIRYVRALQRLKEALVQQAGFEEHSCVESRPRSSGVAG